MNEHSSCFTGTAFPLLVACVCHILITGCAIPMASNYEGRATIHNISSLTSVTPYATVEQVSKTVGLRGQYEFHVQMRGHTFLGMSYCVEGHDAELLFVFCGGKLNQISPRPPDRSGTRVDGHGHRHRVLVPTDPEMKIEELLSMPSLKAGEIEAYLAARKHPPSGIPNVFFPYMAVVALNPVGVAVGEAHSRERGIEFRKLEQQVRTKYDPWLISLNDSQDKVTSIFGKPLLAHSLPDRKGTLSIYGHSMEMPWKIAVVSTGGKVTAIYTRLFYPSAWVPDSPNR